MKKLDLKLWRYVLHYKFNSILWRNFILIMTLIIVPLVGISVFVYAHNNSNMRAEIERTAGNELARIRDTMDLIMSDAEQLSVRIKADPDVALLIAEKMVLPRSYNDAQRILRVQQMLQTVKLTSSYIESVYVYSKVNDTLLTAASGSSLNDDYYAWQPHLGFHSSEKLHYWKTAAASKTVDPLLSFVNRMKLSSGGADDNGSVAINMNLHSLADLLGNSPQHRVYILNAAGSLMYSPDPAQLNQSLSEVYPELDKLLKENISARMAKVNGHNQVVSRLPSKSLEGWSYISVGSFEMYQPEHSQVIRLMAVLLAVSVLTSILLAFIIALRSYRPIRQILSLIENKQNPFLMLGKQPGKEGWNETGYILTNLADSFHQSHSFEVQLQEKYELLRKAQAIALQAQINPHFLYNTLESINWKVMRLTNGKNEASQMLRSLSELLRLTLETKEDLVPIKKELEHVKLYVEMQKLRYKDKFAFECAVEERLLECKIVKLVLQPLVENAIYYGIKPSPHNGLIAVRVFARKEHIVVRVRDNGVGIPPLAVQALNDSLRGDILQENEHIGLKNVNQRIRLAFGDKYGVTVRSKQSVSTIVELTLPMLVAESQEQT
ncbi:MAG: hypothetical protein K0R57_2072 [Paenibacillaceae bacterium]|jgi:two-component system sensor histidine kinase YesM|nr:hypothetical protein [Paenibacillaceae bacterium]